MSRKSMAGKQAWRHRAPGYATELRAQIERDASTRFAAWRARGRLPLWFRVKRSLRVLTVRVRG